MGLSVPLLLQLIHLCAASITAKSTIKIFIKLVQCAIDSSVYVAKSTPTPIPANKPTPIHRNLIHYIFFTIIMMIVVMERPIDS